MDLNKIENLKKMPLIETQIKLSKDGKYMVHKTVITDIKPTNYYEKVMEGTLEEDKLESEQVVA
jgi:hypothetical protein